MIQKVYPQFSLNIFQKYSDLTPSEFQLCALIFLDFTSKEIAQYTFVTHRSVQTSKSRLRKKFEIDGQTDLYQYIKSFG
ncbi:helix-turn-helix transcriptional regulator [Limibacterium fermenti]|uniref:helix-turn-helix transcriptional regulator n=1 Tax=Limibacterium fermenti TaxID=3229863 RepID=UPI003A697B76